MTDAVTWMVETGLDPDSENRLLASLEALGGVEVRLRKGIPFGQGLNPGPKKPPREGPVIYHGSLNGAAWVQANTDWSPGAIANNAAFRCRSYYPAFGDYLLNSRHVFLPFGSLETMKNDLFDLLGADDCIFIRPDNNDKPFTGKLVKREEWAEDMKLLGFYDVVTPDLMVVVARPQNVTDECRFFIQGGRVLTGSLYRKNVYTQQHQTLTFRDGGALWDMAESLAKHAVEVGYNPDPIWVMDLCRGTNGLIRLLEVGGFCGAGLYACDTDIIAEAATELARSL